MHRGALRAAAQPRPARTGQATPCYCKACSTTLRHCRRAPAALTALPGGPSDKINVEIRTSAGKLEQKTTPAANEGAVYPHPPPPPINQLQGERWTGLCSKGFPVFIRRTEQGLQGRLPRGSQPRLFNGSRRQPPRDTGSATVSGATTYGNNAHKLGGKTRPFQIQNPPWQCRGARQTPRASRLEMVRFSSAVRRASAWRRPRAPTPRRRARPL